MKSILAKAEKSIKSNESAYIKSQANISANSLASAAAIKFIEVLRHEIETSGLSPDAIEAISNISASSPYSLGNGKSMITIYFGGDLSRPSLQEPKYGVVDNIVLLLNNGVDHIMSSIYGHWDSHGVDTWSRTVIPGAHFIEQAISTFKGNYAYDYGVVDITTGI